MKNSPSNLAALALLWVIATLFLGGVAAPYERVHVLIATLVSATVIWDAWRTDFWKQAPVFSKGLLVAGLFAFALGFIVFQAFPLPHVILQFISPLADDLTFGTLTRIGIQKTSFGYPISLDPRATVHAFDQTLAFGLLLTSAVILLKKPETRTAVAFFISGFSSFIAFFGLVHRFSGSTRMFWFLERGSTFFGPYVSTNHAGALLAVGGAVSLVLLQRPRHHIARTGMAFLFGIIVLGLLFTGSRASVLGLGSAVLVYTFTQFRRRAHPTVRNYLLGVALVVAVVAIAWQATIFSRFKSTSSMGKGRMKVVQLQPDVTTSETPVLHSEFRPQFWNYAFQLWKQSPVAGTGLGSFAKAVPVVMSSNLWLHPEHAENDYVELLTTLGLVGFLICSIFFVLLIGVLRSVFSEDEPSLTRKSLALGLIAFLADSFFVFNAPLPAHQILFAILIGGVIATRKYSVLGHKSIRILVAIGIFLGLARGIAQLVSTPTRTDDQTLVANPLNSKGLYEFGAALAATGELAYARNAIEAGRRLDPFDLTSQLTVLHIVAENAPMEALRMIDQLLSRATPFHQEFRAQLYVEAADLAVRAARFSDADLYLQKAAPLLKADWRIPLIRSAYSELPLSLISESWKLAGQLRIDANQWDRAFLYFAKLRNPRIPAGDLAAALAPFRSDIGPFLIRLSALDLNRTGPIVLRLDAGKSSPRLRANNPVSLENAQWLSPPGSTEKPEEIEIHVRNAQADLDTYCLPTDIELSPKGLSFRVVVNSHSARAAAPRIVVEIDKKPFVPKEAPTVAKNGKWELEYRHVGALFENENPLKAHRVTGVGFTPLEHDGRYLVEAIEVFVDPAR